MAGGRDQEGNVNAGQQAFAALDRLIAPMAPETFFDRHYDLAPLHCPRADPERYRHLLTIQALDAYIDAADLRHNMVQLVRGQARVPPESFTSADGRIIASAAAEQYLQGATIILPHLQESMPALGDYCRALEMHFSCHVQANAYLTPGGHSGFGAHQDGHDIFVMQIEGAKSWRLYDRCAPSAFRGEAGDVVPGHAEGVRGSFTLHPGDCLYLPRGVVHEADNEGDAPSLHITIGLLTRTWGDLVLAAAAEVARGDPAFARPLPPGYARQGFDQAAMLERLGHIFHSLSGKVQTSDAIDLLVDDFLHGRRPKVAGVIAAGANVPCRGERYRRRPLVQFRIGQSADGPVLTGPGGDLRFGGEERAALDVALSGRLFALPELECPDPKRLFRRLWANGYLEATPDR
jgi:hypothetical protein